MLNKILIGFAVILAVLAIIIQMQPEDFRIQRTTIINAQPAELFMHVNNLKRWQEWSPWANVDPTAKTVYEGTEVGEGSKMSWQGNDQVGVGSMQIVKSQPNEFIQFSLQFEKPYKASNTVEFTFKPQGDKTEITWAMYGKSNFVGKAMGLLIDCDEMVGKQFMVGFGKLNEVVNASRQQQQQ